MISVVVPALNEERYLAKCLESLVNQNYKGKYEIIVVDNGSSDRTSEIAKKFKVKLVSCPRRGVGNARDAGADMASGEIIAQADADTVYPKNWLRRIEKNFSKPGVVAVSGRFVYRDPPFWASRIEYFVRHLLNVVNVKLFGRPLLVSGATFAFRQSAFLKIKGYKKNSLSADQYDISSRLSKLGKVIYDEGLTVSTSSRWLQKPFFELCADVIASIFIFLFAIAKIEMLQLTKIQKLLKMRL